MQCATQGAEGKKPAREAGRALGFLEMKQPLAWHLGADKADSSGMSRTCRHAMRPMVFCSCPSSTATKQLASRVGCPLVGIALPMPN